MRSWEVWIVVKQQEKGFPLIWVSA
jgi:hypothetical protein